MNDLSMAHTIVDNQSMTEEPGEWSSVLWRAAAGEYSDPRDTEPDELSQQQPRLVPPTQHLSGAAINIPVACT